MRLPLHPVTYLPFIFATVCAAERALRPPILLVDGKEWTQVDSLSLVGSDGKEMRAPAREFIRWNWVSPCL